MNQPQQFDDPILKAAVRQTWGAEKAPAALRERIGQELRGAEGTPAPIRLYTRRWFMYAVAAAIALLVSGGLILRAISGHGRLKPAMLAGLVEVHDKCGVEGQACDCSTTQQFADLGGKMCGELKCPVLPANLVDDGWTYRGGGVCPACSKQAAHLTFSRGGQSISVFSLRAPEDVHEGETFVGRVNDHPVAAYVKHGTLFCFVGHCPADKLPPEELRDLLKHHEKEVIESAVAVVSPSDH